MKTPLQRIRIGAVFFAMVVIAAIVGYRLFGYDWMEAIWMVVITVSSVGYSERSGNDDPWFQLFTVFVIVFGMSAGAYTIGGLIQMMTEGELQRALGHRRMTRGIERLRDHVVVCGFGRVGQILADTLQQVDQSFVVIEHDVEVFEEANARGLLCIHGDASDEGILLQAGIEHAKSLVTALPSDPENVFITLTCRELRDDLQIVARAEYASSEKKLRQAGANKVVMPAIIGARQMVRMVTRPSTADLIERVWEDTNLDVELDEITIGESSELVGVSVRETQARRRHGLLVVAIKQVGGEMIFNPDGDQKFTGGDIAVLMGGHEDIIRFRNQFAV